VAGGALGTAYPTFSSYTTGLDVDLRRLLLWCLLCRRWLWCWWWWLWVERERRRGAGSTVSSYQPCRLASGPRGSRGLVQDLMTHHSRRMPTMVPITMPAMAPPSRPEPPESEPESPPATMTVVVGWFCRAMRRVMPRGRVGVGAIVRVLWHALAGWLDRSFGSWWQEGVGCVVDPDPVLSRYWPRRCYEQGCSVYHEVKFTRITASQRESSEFK
jgi:hypothetical protein